MRKATARTRTDATANIQLENPTSRQSDVSASNQEAIHSRVGKAVKSISPLAAPNSVGSGDSLRFTDAVEFKGLIDLLARLPKGHARLAIFEKVLGTTARYSESDASVRTILASLACPTTKLPRQAPDGCRYDE